MGEIEITATLQPRGPAAAFVLTEEQVRAVGEGAKRFPAALTVNGTTVRTTVTRMRGEYLFGFSAERRAEANVSAGETYTFTLARDDAPREVEMPPELTAALAGDPEAERAFGALAHTHRREFARWIAEAKRPETRARRIAQTLTMVRAGETRS